MKKSYLALRLALKAIVMFWPNPREGGTYRGYPLNVNPLLGRVSCGGTANQHMIPGYEGLEYEEQAESRTSRRQEFDG